MDIHFEGKRALVCGSTQGIGEAIAIELAHNGCSVTLMARNETRLRETLGKLATATESHSYLVADFSDAENVRSTVQTHLAQHPGFHILVNNTGGPPGGPIVAAADTEFQAAITQHLVCNHILVQACLPAMKAAAYGRIINVISTSVKQPIPGLGVSNATRGAVASWAKTLAGEVGQFGITVNNVLPGATSTGRLASIIDRKAQNTGASTEEITADLQREIPLRRFAEPQEVAAAAVFLASPAAGYINGVNLPVDGGRTGCL